MYAMFLYEVLFRRVPFFDTPNLLDVSELVAAGERPPILDENLQPVYMNIFKSCWSSNRAERLSMVEIGKIWNELFHITTPERSSSPTFIVDVQYGNVDS